jgi:hypothetical protein
MGVVILIMCIMGALASLTLFILACLGTAGRDNEW